MPPITPINHAAIKRSELINKIAARILNVANIPTPQAIALARQIVDDCEGKR